MSLLDVFTDDELAEADAARERDRAALEAARSSLAAIPRDRNYQAMLDSVKDWQPPELPSLGQFENIILNFETTGVRWYAGDRIVSAVLLTPDGVSRYLPIRHAMGPNIPEEQFFEWMRREVRGKHIDNIRTKFDLHMARTEHVDLEAQGNTFGDVAHDAALLNDHRRRFNLDMLSKDLLGWDVEADPMGKLPPGIKHEGEFWRLPAGIVAPYGIRNVEQVARLMTVLRPQIVAQGLSEVLKLEQGVIPVVVEMEHNGALLDVELLRRWCVESLADMEQALLDIKKATGFDFEKPGRRADAIKLFNYLKVPLPLDPESVETGENNISFADALIRDIQEPSVQNFRKASQLASLRSKFLLKYESSTQRDGILRYELHQLPYQDSEDDEYGGAVSGRFSSAAPSRTEGANIQQVFGVETQKKFRPYTAPYLVKRLFIPQHGQYVNADASQLQFRFFAHYADDPKIIEAYQKDLRWREPGHVMTDFHTVVGNLIKEFAHKELIRTHVKNVNFAQVFGAGVPKMASQLLVPVDQIPSYEEWAEACKTRTTHEIGGPKFQEAVQLSETYHEMFPSVKPLLAITAHLAMPSCRNEGCGKACRAFRAKGYQHRGYVHTIAGRRARFQVGGRFYSALNRIIQGTEGDYVKKCMVAVHNERHSLGLLERFTVHDSLAGDLQGDPLAFKEVLNYQYFDFKVPILWEVGVGPNWAETK